MSKPVKFFTTDTPWFYELDGWVDRAFVDWLKQLPGTRWVPDKKRWLIPTDLGDIVFNEVHKAGKHTMLPPKPAVKIVQYDGMHEYQVEAVAKAVGNKRWLLLDDTGLGKTWEAIMVHKLSCPIGRVLIVTPAIMCLNWMREYDKRYPKHMSIGHITKGINSKMSGPERERQNIARMAQIQVVSYGLVKEIPVEPKYDLIILDEVHRCQSPTTQWSKHIKDLVRANPASQILGLSATPMPDKPIQFWNIADIIWPERFGKQKHLHDKYVAWKFAIRYSNKVVNEYGTKFEGVNEVHQDELRRRIEFCSSRTTKAEVAHLLPAFNVDFLRISPSNHNALGRISRDALTSNFREHTEVLDSAFLRISDKKVEYIYEWFKDAEQDSTHQCIATHHRDLGRRIADKLEGRGIKNVYYIDGSLPAARRNGLLDEARAQPMAVLVCTTQSVGIGIDLTNYTRVLVAELWYKIEALIQFLGRFSRLSSKVPAYVQCMVLEGTIDEVVANRLEEKMLDLNAVYKPGPENEKLLKAMGISDDYVLEALLKAAEAMDEGDGYV